MNIGDDDEDFERWSKRVDADHYAHKFFFWGLGIYVWTYRSFWVAAAIMLAVAAVIIVGNTIALHRGNIEATRYIRWSSLALGWIAGLSVVAEICEAGGQCRYLI